MAESSLVWCFVVSLCLHTLGYGVFRGLRDVAWRQPDSLPTWVRDAVLPKVDAELLSRNQADPAEPEPQPDIEPSIIFVEADPMAVTEQSPSKTKFYSTANTIAGNVRKPDKITGQPLIEGTQDKTVRTFDNDRPRPFAPALSFEDSLQVPQAVAPAESQPTSGLPVGEMQFAKPVPLAAVPPPQAQPKPNPPTRQPDPPRRPLFSKARPSDSPRAQEEKPEPAKPTPSKSSRPKSLAEARAQRGMLVGETMKQEGGVNRLSLVPSLDVRASPFGQYDASMIYVIQQTWYSLLQESRYAYDHSGRVVLRFKLRSDGSVTDMRTIETQVGETLAFICETAIVKPAPFARWPAEMRREIGSDSRDLTFTFNYR